MIIRKIELMGGEEAIRISDGLDALADKDTVSLVFTREDDALYEIYLGLPEWEDLSRAVGQYFEDRALE